MRIFWLLALDIAPVLAADNTPDSKPESSPAAPVSAAPAPDKSDFARYAGAACKGDWPTSHKQDRQGVLVTFAAAQDGKPVSAVVTLMGGANRNRFAVGCTGTFPAKTSVTKEGTLRIDVDRPVHACGPVWFQVRSDGSRLVQPAGFVTLACERK
jgi:hypothetical protein